MLIFSLALMPAMQNMRVVVKADSGEST